MSKAVYYLLHGMTGPCINVARSESSSPTSYIYLKDAASFPAPKQPSSWTNFYGYSQELLKKGHKEAVRITRCRAKRLLKNAGLGHLPLY